MTTMIDNNNQEQQEQQPTATSQQKQVHRTPALCFLFSVRHHHVLRLHNQRTCHPYSLHRHHDRHQQQLLEGQNLQ